MLDGQFRKASGRISVSAGWRLWIVLLAVVGAYVRGDAVGLGIDAMITRQRYRRLNKNTHLLPWMSYKKDHGWGTYSPNVT